LSTIGVKKSTVWTINFPLSKRTTAASSDPLNPTITSSVSKESNLPSTWARSSGPILHAHPDPCEN